jgi:hypothetical protein
VLKRCGASEKAKGDALRVPFSIDVKSCYFFLLFFFAFFLVAMFLFSLSIFHGCAVIKLKTAIDDCIDSSKFEVKQKIQSMLLDDRRGDINLDDQCIGGKPFRATK